MPIFNGLRDLPAVERDRVPGCPPRRHAILEFPATVTTAVNEPVAYHAGYFMDLRLNASQTFVVGVKSFLESIRGSLQESH